MKNKNSFVLALTGIFLSSLSVLANTYYVDVAQANDSGSATSWTTAKKTIQAAVDLTVDGDTVLVRDGTYNLGKRVTPDGGVQTNRVCITNSITLLSLNGPDVTSIEGAAGANGSNDVDSIRGVYMGTNATLSGFTVSNGYSVDSGNYTYDRPGAGIWLTTGAVVSNCVIQGNSTRTSGGGVYLSNGGLLIDSTIRDNTSLQGGGGVHLNYGGTVERCTIENNTDNEFNGGGGARLDGSGGVINRSILRGNEAAIGAGAYIEQGGTLNNCLLINNSASENGGGVSGSESTLHNCTLSGNHADGTGGGFFSGMMGMNTVDNCIIWGNTAGDKPNLGTEEWSGDTIRYICVPSGEGITNGVNGCITSDPLFVSVTTTNYQLQTSSPCVNTGNNLYAPAGTDLAENVRINNSVVDMGAYEQTATLPTYVITTTEGANGTISPDDPSVYQGANQEFSISADLGYRIDTLSVDGSTVPVAGTYTFTNVQSTHTFAATFVIDPHFLTINSGSTAGSYTNAQVVPISADAADAGYEFSHWTVLPSNYVGNLANPSSATTTFTMPQENVELTATYTGIVEVQNISVAQRPGTKLVDISYDVFSGATNEVTISLSISNSTVAVVANALSGDVGAGVATGSGRSIVWDMGADWDGNVADLTFTVLGVSASIPSYSDTAIHSVDSRNYTLEVSSSVHSSAQTGTVQKVSRKGFYDIDRTYGVAHGDPEYPIMDYSHPDSKEARFGWYASESLPLMSWGSLPIGSKALCNGAASIQVDPLTGTLKASTKAKNGGGPRYWYDDNHVKKDFYTSQTWGSSASRGGSRRWFRATGTQPFTVTLNLEYEGVLESEENTAAYFESISLVSLIKQAWRFSYFANQEFSWGLADDLVSATNSYDWIFGENQDVVEFLGQTRFSRSVELDMDSKNNILAYGTLVFTVNPGDLILVGDYIHVSTMTMNPLQVLSNGRLASADGCTVTSELRIEEGSGGGLSEFAGFDTPVGEPIPSVGVHSNYCWMSAVTCSVDAVEGYTNTGWTGTGSVPLSGTSSNTGAIALSDLNSSINWNWEFVGYELTVSGGSGSGTYENGEVVSISADPVGFVQWKGDYADDLGDRFSPSTSLRMPDKNIVLTALYRANETYANAAMPDDSQDGTSWATAKKTIQAAIGMVNPNGTVWVTNGVYDIGGAVAPGGIQTNRVCITRPMTVRSVNGSDVTSIAGDSDWGTGRCVYMTNGCSLIGFTITAGSAAGEVDSENYGGGLLLTEGCIAENCMIVSNWADFVGGGVYLSGGGTLNNSIVRGNGADMYGCGIGISGGTVNNCLVDENWGGGQVGGLVGVHMDGGILNNSTVVSNQNRGGVSGQGSVQNCIVWGNYDPSFPNDVPDISITNGVVTHTCALYGVVNGVNGCITSDPKFVDATSRNFQLLETSPCLDIGDNATAPIGKDLAGSTRIINGTVDFGAYERFVVEADDDSDGLPNWWELQHFESVIGSPPIDALCSNGVNTIRQAFIAGIDPKDPNAAFVAFMEHSPDSDGPIVQWNPVSGRVYSVYWASSLSNPFTLLQSNVFWSADGFIDRDHASDEQGYYKIDVQLED